MAHQKGRGALANVHNRFAKTVSEFDFLGEPENKLVTTLHRETSKRIIATNNSPDVPFEQSINPYKGCEHGCIYCYARPTHAYLDLSPGLDFETEIFYKPDAAQLLERELADKNYRCSPINLGANTDPYQPVERELGITRQLLETCLRYQHPVTIVTKGALVVRDLDLLSELAGNNLCSVCISVTTLDNSLKRIMEPRTASPATRLRVITALADVGIPVAVLYAPVIPAINDSELEAILKAVKDAGVDSAGYVFLRLPLEVKPLFYAWLEQHFPDRKQHVINLVRAARAGRDYDTRFGKRMRGEGVFADLIEQRFTLSCKRLGLNVRERPELDSHRFKPPVRKNEQLGLF
ncbi:MAG: PA0069 family radical SAM protein [Pseudomonadales bacterium]